MTLTMPFCTIPNEGKRSWRKRPSSTSDAKYLERRADQPDGYRRLRAR